MTFEHGAHLEISEDDYITILAVFFTISTILVFSRQYILRHHAATTASRITDASIWSFSALIVNAGAIHLYDIRKEKRIREQLRAEHKIYKAVVTVPYLQRLFVTCVSYTCMLWLLKLAFLGYFSNLRGILTRKARRFFIFVCAYTGISFTAALAFQLGFCAPIQRNWTLDPATQCINLRKLPVIIVQAGLNLSADLLILAMALTIISSLSLKSRSKFVLFFIAGVGSVSIIMCIVRFANLYHAIKNPGNPLLVIRQIHVWGSLELNFALVAFCMPTYRAVLQKKWFKGKEQKKKKSTITTIGGGDAHKRERSRETFETEMCLETLPGRVTDEETLTSRV